MLDLKINNGHSLNLCTYIEIMYIKAMLFIFTVHTYMMMILNEFIFIFLTNDRLNRTQNILMFDII